MARSVRNPKIDTRSARVKLPARREPYWTVISEGCALGYRKGVKGGTWVARFRDEAGKQSYEAQGAADDARDPDGVSVYSFHQAQERAREWFALRAKGDASEAISDYRDYTVAEALDEYFAAQSRKGAKGASKARSSATARIVPELGASRLLSLTTTKIRRWHEGIAAQPKLVRTKTGATERQTKALDADDLDAVRARRATANRILTILKAALNLAFHEGRAASDDAWRKVKPFREVDDPVVRYLSTEESRRFVNACPADFRKLVQGALLSGCRYGELCRLAVGDFNPDNRMLAVRISKAGKVRHVTLSGEGVEFFTQLAAGRPAKARMFLRDDGEPWGASHQARPAAEASNRAEIDPPVTFHVLRHTHGSMLAMAGVPMGVIAAQLGHADTRITEKHYAHLAPSYVADTIRANFPDLKLSDPSNVEQMRKKKAG